MGEQPKFLSAEQYKECFRSALRRMAVAINCPAEICPAEWLRLEDGELRTKFSEVSPRSEKGRNVLRSACQVPQRAARHDHVLR